MRNKGPSLQMNNRPQNQGEEHLQLTHHVVMVLIAKSYGMVHIPKVVIMYNEEYKIMQIHFAGCQPWHRFHRAKKYSHLNMKKGICCVLIKGRGYFLIFSLRLLSHRITLQHHRRLQQRASVVLCPAAGAKPDFVRLFLIHLWKDL